MGECSATWDGVRVVKTIALYGFDHPTWGVLPDLGPGAIFVDDMSRPF